MPEWVPMSQIIAGGLSVLSGLLLWWCKSLLTEVNRLKSERRREADTERRAMKDGVLALLRIQMFEYYKAYLLDSGSIDAVSYDNWADMFEVYSTLGGNGTIAKINEDIKRLRFAAEVDVRR